MTTVGGGLHRRVARLTGALRRLSAVLLGNERGATLVEVAVAVALVAVVVTVLLNGATTHAMATRSVDGNSVAIQLARTQLEDIKASAYLAAYPVTAIPPSAEYVVSVGVVVEQPNLERVTVTVTRSGATLLAVEMYKANLP